MEDIHGFLSKSYDKAAEVPESTLTETILFNCSVAPVIVLKILAIIFLSIIHLLRSLFYLIVPKPLKDIRGHVVVVSFFLLLSYFVTFGSCIEKTLTFNLNGLSGNRWRSWHRT